jgi:hypothetical protein
MHPEVGASRRETVWMMYAPDDDVGSVEADASAAC